MTSLGSKDLRVILIGWPYHSLSFLLIWPHEKPPQSSLYRTWTLKTLYVHLNHMRVEGKLQHKHVWKLQLLMLPRSTEKILRKKRHLSIFILDFPSRYTFISFINFALIRFPLGFPSGLAVKNLHANARDAGSVPGLGRCLENEMANHSSILAWEILWTKEPGGLQSMGYQWVRVSEHAHKISIGEIFPHLLKCLKSQAIEN